MTSQEKENILGNYYSEIIELKTLLYNTDYQAIREFEGGEPMSEDIRNKRSNARTRINEIQNLITETEAIETIDEIEVIDEIE